MMQLRVYNKEKDLPIIKKWWNKHIDSFNEVVLSNTGLIISYKGKDICAGWSYELNSKIVMIGWFIADTSVNFKIRDKCLKNLINRFHILYKKLGFEFCTIYSENDSMINRLKNMNYIVGDKNVTNLFTKL